MIPRNVHVCTSPRFGGGLGVVLFISTFLLLASARPASAYLAGDTATIVSGYTNAFYFTSGTNGYFRNTQTSGSSTYFWQMANEIESVIDAYEWTTNTAYLGMITNLLNGFIKDNGANWSNNGYNDDDLWAVMAFARGGAVTGKTNYCNIAKSNFDMVYARGWDTNLGGGIYWLYPNNASKNACVNGPGAIAASLLYQIYSDTNYWNKATNIYYWERAVLYNSGTGRIYDNINTNGNVDQTPTTYNQGTFNGYLSSLTLGQLANGGSGTETGLLILGGGTNHLDVSGSGTVVTIGKFLSGSAAGQVVGTLTVSNLGMALQGGDVFQLFNQAAGGFSTVNLPALIAGNVWQNNVAVDGSIRVVSTNAPSLAIGMVANQLTLSWPSDHTGWQVQMQTNNLATGLGTNWLDVASTAATNQMTMPVSTGNGSVFFRLVYP